MDTNNDLIKQIKRYQNCIQQVDPPEADPQRILHYIRKLSKLPIKLDELEKTGVGKTINSLRKCNGSIAEEATLLVGKWKAIVKKQVEEEETEEQECVDENNDPSLTPKDELQANTEYEKPKPDRESSLKDHKNKTKKKSSHEKDDKVKVHLITLKKEDLNERKRKHSSDEKDKHGKKEKYKKLEENHAIEGKCNPDSKSHLLVMSIKQEPCSENGSGDSDIDQKKRKENEKKSQKKDHDKRHHKSSKHSHREEKHHKHHSKSSHHDKKQNSEDKSSSYKHKNDKKSKSGSKVDNESKKEKNLSKKTSETDLSMARSNNRDIESSHDYGDENSDDAVGNDFGSVLLGISTASTTPKKKSTSSRSSSYQDSPQAFTSPKPVNDIDKLCSNIKLEPLSKDLDIPDVSYSVGNDSSRETLKTKVKTEGYQEHSISPNYYSPKDRKSKPVLINEDEMLSSMTTTKNQRTKVFSGSKLATLKFPTLFELCVRVLQDNFDALEYTGGVPFDVLKPILEKVSVEQLYRFENFNPYLIGETDELWECHAKKHFRKVERQEFETWRDLYLRCVEEREEKLQSLTENISQSIANSTPVRKTKLAYVDVVAKPPRNVARSQAKYGTGQISVKKPSKESQPSATAIQSVKERLAKEAAAPTAVQIPTKSNFLGKKKKAPLMQKTLQLFKGLKR